MEPKLSLFLALCLSVANAGPLQWQSSQCSRHCSHNNAFVAFGKHQTFEYDFTTTTSLAQQLMTVSGRAIVTSHDDCDLSLYVRNTRFQGIEDSQTLKTSLETFPLHFGYDDGLVTDVCVSPRDSQWAQDVKKAIVSALQMSARSNRETLLESDISGDCQTQYSRAGNQWTKSKQLNECAHRAKTSFGFFPRAYPSSLYSSLPLMNANYQCIQTIDKQLFQGVTCRETQTLKGYASGDVVTELELKLLKQENGLYAQRVDTLSPLSTHLKMGSHLYRQTDVSSVVRALCHSLDSEDQFQTSDLFSQLVENFKSIQSLEEIQRYVESCQNQQFKDLVLDAAVLSGSESGSQLLKHSFSDLSKERTFFLFHLLSFTAEPSSGAAKQLIPLLKSEKVDNHVMLGISALIHNLKESGKESHEKEAVEALNALLERRKGWTRVPVIKALANIGLEKSREMRRKVMSLALSKEEMTSVRVASIATIGETMTSEAERQQLLALFQKDSESNEVRIRAYKAIVMSGVKEETLESIKTTTSQTNNRDIQQFVRSHQKNLRETSDPHKRYSLPSKSVQFSQPSKQWFGISNNFENSFMIDALGFGVALEADLIHESHSPVPQTLIVNFTLPAFGKELQFFELEIRQKGIDLMTRKEFLKEINEIFSRKEFPNDKKLEFHLKVDGKTLFSFDSHESREYLQFLQHFKQIFSGNTDRAIGLQPINTRLQLPTAGGLPLELRVNASIIASLKSKIEDNWKSVSFQPIINAKLETALQISADSHRKTHALVAHMTAAPKWQSVHEIRDGLFQVKVHVPDSQTLLRVQTRVVRKDSQHVIEEKSVWPFATPKQCVQWISVSFCSDFSERKGFQLNLEKHDSALNTIDLALEYPRDSQQLGQYRVHFNTPNSASDRELLAELLIERNAMKAHVRTPFLSLESRALNEEKEKSFHVQIETEGKKALQLEVSLETQQRGQKREFRPKVRVQVLGREALQLMGSVSLARGRKNSLQIQLEGNQKQFLKGSFVREGEKKSQDLRLSTDLSANLGFADFRVHGLAERSSKHSEADLTLEYRLPEKRKESLKVSFKVQNLTQSQLTKVSAFGELTSTHFPNANFHVAYNLLARPQQQLENEFTLQWNQRLDSKVHVLTSTKLTSERIENTLSVEVTPLRVNYELRVNADLKHAQSGPQFASEVIGKDRNGRRERDLKANFNFKHVSRSPLHLTLAANLKTSARDFSYSDSLVERARGEYSGDTRVSWSPNDSAILKYVYKRNAMNHEMDAKLEAMGRTFSHAGLLRLQSPFRVKSALHSDDSALYSLDSSLESGSAAFDYSSRGYATKAMFDSRAQPRVASLEIETPFGLHKTSSQWSRDSLDLKSDTKDARKANLVTVEASVARSSPSRLALLSGGLAMNANYDFSNPKKSLSFDVKSESRDFSHSSHVDFDAREMALKSKSVSKGSPLLVIDSRLSRSAANLNLAIPNAKTSLSLSGNNSRKERNALLEFTRDHFQHKSEVSLSEKQKKFQTKTLLNRRPLLALDFNNNGQQYALHSDLLQNYQLEGVAATHETQPFLEVNAKSKSHQIESKSRFSRDNDMMKFESKTKRFSQPLNEIHGFWSPNQKSLQVSGDQWKTSVSRKPSETHWQWNCPEVSHETRIQSNPDFSLDSKTLFKRNEKFLHLNANHALRMSRISVKSNSLDSELSRDHNSGKLVIESRDAYPLSHVTQVTASPETWLLESRSSHSGNPLYSLDSEMSFVPQKWSRVALSLGKDFSLETKGNVFQKNFEFKAKNPKLFNHFSSLETNDSDWQFKSRTEDANGANLAKIDSFVSPRDKSHISVVVPRGSGQLEVASGGAKLELNCAPFHHKTVLSRDNSLWSLQSKTTKAGEALVSVDSEVRPWSEGSRLSFAVEPHVKSALLVNPSQKSLLFSVRTPRMSHETSFSPKELNSRTLDSKQVSLALIRAQTLPPSLEIDFPSVRAKSSFDLKEKSALLELESRLPQKRHVLASVRAKEGFHLDVSWDPKDDSRRLSLDFSRREDRQQVIAVTRLDYSGNELTVSARMTPSELVRGPHALNVEYKPKFNALKDFLGFEAKHEIKDNRMECLFQYTEGSRHKFSAKVDAKLESGLQVSLETTSPNPELEMRFSLIERHENLRERNAKIFTEIQVLRSALHERISFSLDAQREGQQLKGKSRLETTANGIHEIDFDVTPQQLRVQSRDVEVSANYGFENGFSLAFDLKSRIKSIPSLAIHNKVNSREILAFAEVRGQRVFDLLLTKSGDSLASGLALDGKVASLWSPKVESRNRVKRNWNSFSFSQQNDWNSKEISSLEISADKLNGQWSGSARVAHNGAELAKASLESQALGYKGSARSDVSWIPIRATFDLESARHQKRLSVSACQQKRCLDAKLDVSAREAVLSVSRMGETLEAKVALFAPQKASKQEENVLSVDNGRVVARYLTEALVRVNSHFYGFDWNEWSREKGFSNAFRLFLPNNEKLELLLAQKNDKKEFQISSEVKRNAKRLFAARLETNERKASLAVSSEKWRREKSVVLEWSHESFKAFFDLKEEKNALQIESLFHENYNQNKTFSLSVKTRDGSVDYSIESHLSSKSFGINFQNIRKQKLFSLQTKALNRNDWKRSQSSLVFSKNSYLIDVLVDKSIDVKIREEKSGKLYDVTVQRDDRCATLEVREESADDKRFQFCLDFETKDKILGFSLAHNEKKAFEVKLSARDQNPKLLRASVEWNARELQQLLSDSQWASYEWTQEIAREVKSVSEKLLQPFSDAFNDIIVELVSLFDSRIVSEWMEALFARVDYFFDFFDKTFESFQHFFQRIAFRARKVCKRYDYCYRALYALDNYGLDVIGDALSHSHALVVKSVGHVTEWMPSTPDWLHAIADYFHETFDSILDSNPELRRVWTHVTDISEELTQEWSRVNWSSVQKSVKAILEILFSEGVARVVVWDPQGGRLAVDVADSGENVREVVRALSQRKTSFY